MITPADSTYEPDAPHCTHLETDSSTNARTNAPTNAATNAPPVGAAGAAAVVPLLSPDQIHGRLEQAFRDGNRARLRFVRLLHALAASRLYVELGHPSIAHYAERRFGVQRSETFEMLRVAEIVDERPACREAFEQGRLSWSALKVITRVASAETEETWLSFAAEHTFAELRAEVQDAQKKNRDHPREDRFGLPDLRVRFSVELSREEHARLRTAMEKAGAEIAPALGQTPLEPGDVLLYLVERFLRTDANGKPEGRIERGDSPYVIVYQQCGSCGRARVATEDGPVEVTAERVDQLADATRVTIDNAGGESTGPGSRPGSAIADSGVPANTSDPEATEPRIDRPNPPALSRKVKLRDSACCQNPGCRSRGPLHAHHIHHRSRGGRTTLENEVAVCTTCHALLHAGLLHVSGDPFFRLAWTPRSSRLAVDTPVDYENRAPAAIPTARPESAIADSGMPAKVNAPTAAPPAAPARAGTDLENLSSALVRLGLGKKVALARLEQAWLDLTDQGETPDDDRLVRLAISG